MGESQNLSNYKEGIKATSLFGGVQVFIIITGIIRSKIVAVLLGTNGMGFMGLLTSTTNLISTYTNCGLATSAVREISISDNLKHKNRIARTIYAVKRLIWLTGIGGTLICALFSPFWSQLCFGNFDHWFAFVLLSVTVLLTQLTLGRNAILQGLKKYRYLAKANVWGNALGLIVVIPLYYIWKTDAIVPCIIIATAVTFLGANFYSNKAFGSKIKLSNREVLLEGKEMMQIGVFISLRIILSISCAYVTRIFIGNIGSIEEVGLYTAAFAITNNYCGLIFNAMEPDYFPRLSKVSHDSAAFNNAINQQIEICLTLLSPIIVIFIIFINPLIRLFYSSEFLPINNMLYWTIFGMFLRAPSWAIAFSFLAKGDTKSLLFNDLFSKAYTLSLDLIFYYYWGLTGLGISFVIGYVLYLTQVTIVCGKKYSLNFDFSNLFFFAMQLLMAVTCIIIINYAQEYKYLLGIIIILISGYLSYGNLNKKIQIKKILLSKFNINK